MKRSDEEARELITVQNEIKAALDNSPDNAMLQQLLKEAQDACELNHAQASEDGIEDAPQLTSPPAAPCPHQIETSSGVSGIQVKRQRPMSHPDNILISDTPDFLALAKKHQHLTQYIKQVRGQVRFEWSNWHANHALAQALFIEYFGIVDWSIPPGRLIPTIPNRFNYILWIKDLLDLSSSGNTHVCGLDIGCGCNLVYPLLGASHFGWHFTAADTDPVAISNCKAILRQNPSLEHLIKLQHSLSQLPIPQMLQDTVTHENCSPTEAGGLPTAVSGPLMCAAVEDHYDFCMCNPPFFVESSAADSNARTQYGGTDSEMVCSGGEEQFVRAMISDSAALEKRGKGTCHWYTTMLGRKVTFKRVKDTLHSMKQVTAIRSFELVQGKTARWVVGWSYSVPRSLQSAPLRSGRSVPRLV